MNPKAIARSSIIEKLSQRVAVHPKEYVVAIADGELVGGKREDVEARAEILEILFSTDSEQAAAEFFEKYGEEESPGREATITEAEVTEAGVRRKTLEFGSHSSVDVSFDTQGKDTKVSIGDEELFWISSDDIDGFSDDFLELLKKYYI